MAAPNFNKASRFSQLRSRLNSRLRHPFGRPNIGNPYTHAPIREPSNKQLPFIGRQETERRRRETEKAISELQTFFSEYTPTRRDLSNSRSFTLWLTENGLLPRFQRLWHDKIIFEQTFHANSTQQLRTNSRLKSEEKRPFIPRFFRTRSRNIISAADSMMNLDMLLPLLKDQLKNQTDLSAAGAKSSTFTLDPSRLRTTLLEIAKQSDLTKLYGQTAVNPRVPDEEHSDESYKNALPSVEETNAQNNVDEQGAIPIIEHDESQTHPEAALAEVKTKNEEQTITHAPDYSSEQISKQQDILSPARPSAPDIAGTDAIAEIPTSHQIAKTPPIITPSAADTKSYDLRTSVEQKEPIPSLKANIPIIIPTASRPSSTIGPVNKFNTFITNNVALKRKKISDLRTKTSIYPSMSEKSFATKALPPRQLNLLKQQFYARKWLDYKNTMLGRLTKEDLALHIQRAGMDSKILDYYLAYTDLEKKRLTHKPNHQNSEPATDIRRISGGTIQPQTEKHSLGPIAPILSVGSPTKKTTSGNEISIHREIADTVNNDIISIPTTTTPNAVTPTASQESRQSKEPQAIDLILMRKAKELRSELYRLCRESPQDSEMGHLVTQMLYIRSLQQKGDIEGAQILLKQLTNRQKDLAYAELARLQKKAQSLHFVT